MEFFTPTNIITLVLGLISGTAFATIIKGFIDRRITRATARTTEITGEVSIVKIYQEYAAQQKLDKEELRGEFNAKIEEIKVAHTREIEEVRRVHSKEIEDIKKDFEAKIVAITKTKDDEIFQLNGRITSLQSELDRYKGVGERVDTEANKLHKAIDESAQEIKKKKTIL